MTWGGGIFVRKRVLGVCAFFMLVPMLGNSDIAAKKAT